MASDSSLQSAQAQNYVAAMVPENAKARVEIEEFLDDNDMTNLFLLALSEMQKEDPGKKTEKDSQDWWTFYSLSGTWFGILLWFHSLNLDSKAFMAYRGSYGTMFRTSTSTTRRAKPQRPAATVHMAQLCFQHGTAFTY